MAPSSQIPDIHPNHSALLFSPVLTYHAVEKVRGRQEETWKEYHKLYKAVGLKLDISSHKMRNMSTPHPKIKSFLKKSSSPNDHHFDLEH